MTKDFTALAMDRDQKKARCEAAMKAALTAAEIARMGLPGLNPERPQAVIGTERGVRDAATRDGWAFETRKGMGGGRLYPVATLPAPWREALTAAIARGVPGVLAALGMAPIGAAAVVAAVAPAPEATPAAGPVLRRAGSKTLALKAPVAEALTERQARVRDARAAVLAEIDRLVPAARLGGAITTLLAGIAAGSVRPELLALVAVANDRADDGGERTLSRRTILRWRALREAGGVAALAPLLTVEPDTAIPAWGPYFLAAYQQPQKPSAQEVWRTLMLPDGVARPSYDQVRRFLAKLAPYSRERGRCGPNALKAYRAHTVRDTSALWPTAVYIADGHTFKAKVQHPLHGQPFQPEITTVLDVATRAAVGWSVGVVENSIGVLEALSSAMAPAPGQPGGVPAIFYSDLGKGFKNEILSATATGFYARWGIFEEHSRARNSQARGIIEHFHATVYTPAAKSLATFCGPDMDKDAARLIDKANKAAEKDKAPHPYTVPWPEFVALIRQRLLDYNQRPHSALPEVSLPGQEVPHDRGQTHRRSRCGPA